MLRKLFKYDMKYVSRIMLPIYAALLAVTGLFCFLLYLENLWDSVVLFSAGVIFLYVVLLIATAVAPTILIAVRIFSNLYGDEGYLMHTLPVKPTSHLWSKCWTAILFEVISIVAAILSILVLVFSSLLISGISFSEIVQTIRQYFPIIWDAIKELLSDSDILAIVIVYLLTILISPFYTFFMIFSACSLGQRARKHKILASFGAYFGISFAVSTLNQILSLIFILSSGAVYADDVEVFGVMFVPLLCQAIVYLALTVTGYGFSRHSLERRLNLE